MFKRYPFIKQEGIKDCGVTSLLMIIQYYKGYIGLEELRDMTKTGKNGTTAYHIIEAAKKLGFEAKGIKCSIGDINKNNIILPCIAHVTLEESYYHYVVIYEINFNKKVILIADSSSKIKKISFDEFNKIWNNILIVLYPTAKVPIYDTRPSLYNFISYIIVKSKSQIKTVILLSIIVTIFSILTSFFFKYMIDSISNSNSKSNLLYIFIIFFTLYILKIVSDFFRNKLLIFINQKIDLTLTHHTFEQIISLPYNYYCNRTTGEIVSRIGDLGTIRDMISKVAIALFVDLPLTIFSFFLLYFISDTLFVISLIILILYVINIILFKPIFTKYINSCQEMKAKVTSYMVESISGFETVKGLNLEEKVINNFGKKYVNLLKNLFKFDNYYNLQYLFKEIINNIGFITIIYFGCVLVINKELSFGELLTFNALLVYFLDPIRNITDLYNSIKESKNALHRVLELFHLKKEQGIIEKEIDGVIELKNLNYTYNDQDYVLKNICLKINKGEKVMIIGNSGSGKSTLLKLIKGYYKVNRGQIIINDIDINDYNFESVRTKLGYISQKEMLFTDTLYNNLNITDSTNTSQVFEVAKLCYVDQIVKNNKLGYKMFLEENGFNISGGEKQRIILARCLLKPFNVLLIDEGLNQIDLNLERKILKNIFAKFKKETIIIVSHRIENIDLFDKVVEFRNGQIERVVCRNG